MNNYSLMFSRSELVLLVMKRMFIVIGYFLSFIYPYFIAKKIQLVYRLLYTSWLYRRFKEMGERTVIYPTFKLLHGAKYITIGSRCTIGKDVQLTAWDSFVCINGKQKFTPEIKIGDNCSIGDHSHVTAINSIIIGDNLLTGKNVLITDNAHGASQYELLDISPDKRPLYSKGPIFIGDNVWIGEKVSIMPGVCIGSGAIIAANSVVTKDIPSHSVAAGVPARVFKIVE